MTEKEGDVYTGNWANGWKHGKGKMNMKNGDVLEASWEMDVINGEGSLTTAKGEHMKAIWYNGITVPMSGQDRGCCDRAGWNIVLVVAMLISLVMAAISPAESQGSFGFLFFLFYCINLCDGCCNKTIKYISNIEMLSNTESMINGLRLSRPNI
jgi:uncharacterized membrane protein YhdT